MRGLLIVTVAASLACQTVRHQHGRGHPAGGDRSGGDRSGGDLRSGDHDRGDDPGDVIHDDDGTLPGDFRRGDRVGGDLAGDAHTGDSLTGDAHPAGMHPQLALPGAAGTPCMFPGAEIGCGFLEVCRIYSSDQGRCETCILPQCGLLGDPCTRSEHCDIIFQCFAGTCTNICELGTFNCGPVEDCLDVGNATYGVCRP